MKPISIFDFSVNEPCFQNIWLKYILSKGSYTWNVERSTLWYNAHVFPYNQRFSILQVNWQFKIWTFLTASQALRVIIN